MNKRNVGFFSGKFLSSKIKGIPRYAMEVIRHLNALMQQTKALLFSSMDEGVELPPLEALASGTPVIASDIPVLREIYGNAIHYVNPYKYDIELDSLLHEPTES